MVVSKRTERFPEPIIKRIIATENQRIRFDFTTGCVWVDDVLIEEDYIAARTLTPEDLQSGVTYTVPENCVFVMGDNRNESADSRLSYVGMVDERCVLGKAVAIALPGQTKDLFGDIVDPRDWGRIGLVS